MSSLSRRNLLRGNWRGSHHIRPPWVISEQILIDNCTRCHACINSCETNVLISGSGGYPEIDFARAECTFCKQCVAACQEHIFNETRNHPWNYQAEIEQTCLTYKGIECRVCQDNCDMLAIRFRLTVGRVAQPQINLDLCNGCGACVKSCPVKAVDVSDHLMFNEQKVER